MAIGNVQAGTATNIAASAAIKTGSGVILGVLVNSSTAGTLTLYDNTGASGTKITNAFPLTAGQVIGISAGFATGLYAAIGGTADITVIWL